MKSKIKNIAVVFYGQSRTYSECAENIKTFFSTKNPDINIDFICSLNTEINYPNSPEYNSLGDTDIDSTVVDDIKNVFNPVHMSTYSSHKRFFSVFPIYIAMLHAMSEKKKYEIKHDKYYDLTILCRYDMKFKVDGNIKLDEVFDFLINTIEYQYSIESTPTNDNFYEYNIPFYNPNLFVTGFANCTVPTKWFRPQDVFINGIDDYIFIGTGVAIDMLFSIIANMCYVPDVSVDYTFDVYDFKQDFYLTRLSCTHHDLARAIRREKINLMSLTELLTVHGTLFTFGRVRPDGSGEIAS